MTPFERCKRNHPSQIAADKRALENIEKNLHETAPEPEYPKQRKWVMTWRY